MLLALVLAPLAPLLGARAAAAQEGGTLTAAVERGVVEADVVTAVETAGRVRILAVFRTPGEDGPKRGNLRANAARARLVGEGFHPGRRFFRLPGLAGSVDARALALLAEDPDLVRVSLETPVSSQLEQAVPLVGLDVLHGMGVTGTGSTVGIVDTGVDLDHADLVGSVIAEQCYCDDGAPGPGGCCPNGTDEQSGPGAGQDDHGHGTRVAGIITSDGVHAPPGGAPDAQLIVVKALNSSGGGMATDVLAGLDWLVAQAQSLDVVNMSLGTGLYPGDCDDADAVTMLLASGITQLRAQGVLTVAGAGNNGSGSGMIAPACVADAIAVGAVWDADVGSQTWFGCTDATTAADQVACWSNSSPTTDLFAPGARMTSSLLDGTRVTLAGTSYATPMVAACVAALGALDPEAGADALAAAIATSGIQVVDATNGLQFPRLDCGAARAALAPAIPSAKGLALGVLALLVCAVALPAWRRRRGRAGAA